MFLFGIANGDHQPEVLIQAFEGERPKAKGVEFYLDPRGGAAAHEAMVTGNGSSLAQGLLLLDVSLPSIRLATAGGAMTKLNECNTTIIAGLSSQEYRSGC